MDRIDVRTGRPAVRRSGLPITWLTSRPGPARRLGLRRPEGALRITWTRDPVPRGVAVEV
jgi:hypothetical protein